MIRIRILSALAASVLLCSPAMAQGIYYPGSPQPWARSFSGSGSEAADGAEKTDFEEGLRALDARNWKAAEAAFSRVVKRNGSATDAALYWKAYAESRGGNRSAALETIAALRSKSPGSRWARDAEALQVELHATGLRRPMALTAEPDNNLKLLAINSLLLSKPEVAVPALRGVLDGDGSPALKERALFVLTQSPAPEARQLVTRIARGGNNLKLQSRAVQYMGMLGGPEAQTELASIYKTAANPLIKKEVLQGLARSGSHNFLMQIAKTDPNNDLRKEAISQLLLSGGGNDAWKLYESSSSAKEKRAILDALFMSGNGGRLLSVARNGKDQVLRLAAIQSLGMMGKENGHAAELVELFPREQDPKVRSAILQALFMQADAKGLVSLARASKDPQTKAEIMQQLSMMPSEETSRYLVELLKK